MPVLSKLASKLSKEASKKSAKVARENRKRLKDHEDFKYDPETLEEYIK